MKDFLQAKGIKEVILDQKWIGYGKTFLLGDGRGLLGRLSN